MIQRALDILLGPAATVVKQALFGPVAQLGVYAPAVIWFVAHKDDNFACMSYGVAGIIILVFAWTGWILTRRRAGEPP